MGELGDDGLVGIDVRRVGVGENKSEVEDELIARVGRTCEADGVAEDEVGRRVWTGRGRAEGDEVSAEGLAWYDEGGDRREGEEGRLVRGIGLVTGLHDGVLGHLVDNFGTFTKWQREQLVQSARNNPSYLPGCRTCCRRLL